MGDAPDFVAVERERLLAAYKTMPLSTTPELYAPWQPAEQLNRGERVRVAAGLLHQLNAFPRRGDQCLEIGFGEQGWLRDLTTWGVPERNLHGIELDAERVAAARYCLPMADLRVGDATSLPWDADTFHIVIASTVFSSILDDRVRQLLAAEIMRVLAPGGALVWYDFAVNSPTNAHVRKVGRRELCTLFRQLRGSIKAVTLAPPLARLIAPWSWTLAVLLRHVPPLRTHLLAVLVK